MKRLPVPVLCLLIMAGCQSSEPQNVAYQPATGAVSATPAPLPAPVTAVASQQIAAPQVSSSQLPPPADPTMTPVDQQAAPPTDTAAAMALEYGTTCRTVGEVTMCDAPASADDTDYSN